MSSYQEHLECDTEAMNEIALKRRIKRTLMQLDLDKVERMEADLDRMGRQVKDLERRMSSFWSRIPLVASKVLARRWF